MNRRQVGNVTPQHFSLRRQYLNLKTKMCRFEVSAYLRLVVCCQSQMMSWLLPWFAGGE